MTGPSSAMTRSRRSRSSRPPGPHPDMVRIVHDGKRYILEGHRGEGSFRDLLKWQMEGNRARWPRRVANRSYAPPPQRVEGAALKATWVGHSTVLLQTAGLNILTDPFLSTRASPVPFAGPKRVRPAALTPETLPPIDLILLSHNHYDHMDLPALRRIARRPCRACGDAHRQCPLGAARLDLLRHRRAGLGRGGGAQGPATFTSPRRCTGRSAGCSTPTPRCGAPS